MTDREAANDKLTFSLASGSPSGLSINPATGALSWTPSEGQGPGPFPITVQVSDDGVPPLNYTEALTLTVTEVNKPPVLNLITDKTADELTLVTFTATATDPDLPTNPLAFSLGPNAPAGAAITAAGVFTWTPTEAQAPSTNQVAIIVTDTSLDNANPHLTATQIVNIVVKEVNVAPVLAVVPLKTVSEGAILSFNLAATDSDLPLNPLKFSLGAGAPVGATLTDTGVFSWTPSETQGPGTNTITVTVTDASTDTAKPALTDTKSFTVVVTESNRPPVLNAIGPKTINELSPLTFTATATDADFPANRLTFSLGAGAPSGAAISTNGVFTWTPSESQGPSTNSITVIVTDDSTDPANPRLNASETIIVVVNELNVAPVLLAIAPLTAVEGALINFTISASDSDLPANPLKFSLGAGAPSGATLAETGTFSWTPSEAQGPSTNTVTVTVTDASADTVKPALTDTKSFTIVVTEANRPPVLSTIGPKTVNELSLLTFTATANDPDLPANRLTFSLGAGTPAGATISTNGVFTWSPTEPQGPSTNAIIVIVTDDSTDPSNPRLTASETVSVVVREVNSPPQIAPIPNQTAAKGSLLTIPVSASDSDFPANLLSFSLDTPPAGATIDAATGVLTFIPGDALAGTTNTITVKVSDNGSPSLSATQSFRITVSGGVTPAAPKIGSITVDSRGVTIVASSTPGKSYALEFSASVETTIWTRQTAVTAAGSSVTLIDATATGTSRRFYRVVEL